MSSAFDGYTASGIEDLLPPVSDLAEWKSQILQDLKAGQEVLIPVKGVSMLPLFKEGRDSVLVTPLKKEEVKPGMILFSIREDHRFLLHRVLQVQENGYIQRGDNCLGCEYVPAASALGVAAEIVRADQTISLSSFGYRLFGSVWTGIFPVRSFYKRGKGFLARILKRRSRA